MHRNLLSEIKQNCKTKNKEENSEEGYLIPMTSISSKKKNTSENIAIFSFLLNIEKYIEVNHNGKSS